MLHDGLDLGDTRGKPRWRPTVQIKAFPEKELNVGVEFGA